MEIQRGGFGSVWKAYDYFTGEYVAIKYLIDVTPENLDMFQREVRELTKPDLSTHPQIVKLLDSNLNSWNPYYVMEYCPDGSLAGWIGKTDWRDAITIMKAMVYALKPLHKSGGYHGDFKPYNILLASDEKGKIPKLADFGLAHTPNLGSTMTWSPRGTDPYKAPEVRMKLNYSPKADIYSFGITIFELLTGEPEIPWLIKSPGPKKLIDLLRRMTQSNPALRPDLTEIEIQLIEIESNLESVGINKFVSSLGYGDWAVCGLGLALVLGVLFENKG